MLREGNVGQIQAWSYVYIETNSCESCELRRVFHLNCFFVSDQKPSIKRQSSGRIKGELKLTLEYRRDSLHVMVCHAKNLALPDGSKEEPNSYAKVGSPRDSFSLNHKHLRV